MKKLYQYLLLALSAMLSFSSCNSFVEVPESKNQVETSIVFADSSTATAALLSIYHSCNASVSPSIKYLSLYAGEYRYTAADGAVNEFQIRDLAPENSANNALWANLYSIIYQSNSLIEQLGGSSSLWPSTKSALTSEAKFLRAFAYFYLVNLYDHIPLVLTTEVDQNAKATQVSPMLVYQQMIKDLQDAQTSLGQAYKGSGKVRANNLAATALLARIYLYQNKWADAEREATKVIGSALYSPLPPLENVFLAGSKESILQLWNDNGFLADATSVIPASASVVPPYVLDETLLQQMESTDGRRAKWTATNNITTAGISRAYVYPSKYKNRLTNTTKPEYLSVLRLSEQYLIRAEAFAQQSKLTLALADLNTVRTRAGLSPLPAELNQQACLEAIAKERHAEFFGEWGHRLLDLKRQSQPGIKPFPIPQNELTYNPNLIQNEDY